MGVTFKGWVLEAHRAKHSIVTWVRVPPETAFAYVADITRHNEWTEHEIKVTPLTPGPVRLGSRYDAVGRQRGRDWPSQLEVTVYEPPRRFEFTSTGGPGDVPGGDPHLHEFLFTPQNGGTQLEIRRTDPFPPNMPSWFMKIVGVTILMPLGRRHRVRTIERLRAQLEELTERQS